MDKEAALEIIRRFQEALVRQGVKSSKLVLFGSFSKGTYHEDSDIDLVVISRHFEGEGYWERIEILAKAISEVFEPIEAIAMTPEEWERGDSLVVHFAREGEVVCEG